MRVGNINFNGEGVGNNSGNGLGNVKTNVVRPLTIKADYRPSAHLSQAECKAVYKLLKNLSTDKGTMTVIEKIKVGAGE